MKPRAIFTTQRVVPAKPPYMQGMEWLSAYTTLAACDIHAIAVSTFGIRNVEEVRKGTISHRIAVGVDPYIRPLQYV